MNKKTDNNKNNIIIICLISVLVACVVIGIMNNQNKNENSENNSNINIDGLDSFVEKYINDSDFIQVVREFSRNNKIEYCIGKIMKSENVSSVAVDKIAEYYIETFGDDYNDSVIDYLRIDNLNNYKLSEETNKYTKKEINNDYEHISFDNVKIKLDSKKVEQNQVVVKIKMIQPKQIMEYCSYYANKKSNDDNNEKYREINNKLNDIRIRYDSTNELTKEDVNYLLELAEEDIDQLAYVSYYDILIEKLDNGFVIKDIKSK